MPSSYPPVTPISVFYSYSHKDEGLRKKLETHLSLLRDEGLIKEWYDRRIEPGMEWDGVISENLEKAHIILLLVSADFLASQYCRDVEIARAMQRHEAGTARVVPVILRPVDWHSASFGKLQALPKNGKPVITWKYRDEGFTDIARGIREVTKGLATTDSKTANAVRSAIGQSRNLTDGDATDRNHPLDVATTPITGGNPQVPSAEGVQPPRPSPSKQEPQGEVFAPKPRLPINTTSDPLLRPLDVFDVYWTIRRRWKQVLILWLAITGSLLPISLSYSTRFLKDSATPIVLILLIPPCAILTLFVLRDHALAWVNDLGDLSAIPAPVFGLPEWPAGKHLTREHDYTFRQILDHLQSVLFEEPVPAKAGRASLSRARYRRRVRPPSLPSSAGPAPLPVSQHCSSTLTHASAPSPACSSKTTPRASALFSRG